MILAIDQKLTGKHLHELCIEKGFSVTDVQKELGLKSPQSIYRWYYGDAMPTIAHLYALAIMLETPIEGLLVIKQADISEEHIKSIIKWYANKTKESDDLKKAYWEALGMIIIPIDQL